METSCEGSPVPRSRGSVHPRIDTGILAYYYSSLLHSFAAPNFTVGIIHFATYLVYRKIPLNAHVRARYHRCTPQNEEISSLGISQTVGSKSPAQHARWRHQLRDLLYDVCASCTSILGRVARKTKTSGSLGKENFVRIHRLCGYIAFGRT
jgi:hypothetical protein